MIIKKVFALVLMCLCFFGCETSTHETYVRVNLGKDPTTLDPRLARDLQSLTISKMLFEGLTRIDQEGIAQLALADKVDISEDGKTYLFTLKKAKWTDNSLITAKDFALSWLQALGPNFPATQSFQMYIIHNAQARKEGKVEDKEVGIKVIDDRHLEIQLKDPAPYFLDLLANPIFFPVKSTVLNENNKIPICNGPFVLNTWKPGNILTVRKNTEYWDAQNVKLSGIELMMVSEDVELEMFEKKDLDWAGSPLSTLPVSSLDYLRKRGLLQVKPFLGTYFFRTNTESDLLKDPNIRKALALAITRQEIVQHVTQGGQQPATSLVPPALKVESVSYFHDGDILQAKKLFQEGLSNLGFSQENIPYLTLLYITGERNHLIAQAVQSQWKKALGISIKLEAVEQKVFFDRITKRDFQLAAGSWIADFKDSINFLDVFKFKNLGPNNTAWENKTYQDLLDEASGLQDFKQRHQRFRNCEAILMDQMPIIPIFHYTLLYVSNKNLKNVVLSDLGNIDFKWAYLDK